MLDSKVGLITIVEGIFGVPRSYSCEFGRMDMYRIQLWLKRQLLDLSSLATLTGLGVNSGSGIQRPHLLT